MRSKAKRYLVVVAAVLSFTMTGCGNKPQKVQSTRLMENSSEYSEENSDRLRAENIIAFCQDIYERAAEENTSGSLEMMRSIIEGLGENGYTAVDEKNQINMTGAEQVIQFCESVDTNENAELTIIIAAYSGGFTIYDLKAADGKVDVIRSYYQYKSGNLEHMSTDSYPAESWQYTQEGYLLFEGSFYSESYYTLLLSDMSEHVALRVLPLDEKCRELNRQYILPVGYRENNMFLTEWDERDFGSLDFYDLFDRIYPLVYGEPIPYTANENSGVGTVYQIPENIFENAVQEYVRIDSEELRQKNVYLPEDKAYEYKPRGFYENEYSEIPYPEAVSFTENDDGTITLVVNAVYSEDNTSRAYTHEVTVRPMDGGCFQYVSNHLVYPENGYDAWWHSERLTEEQWKEVYGNNNSIGEL